MKALASFILLVLFNGCAYGLNDEEFDQLNNDGSHGGVLLKFEDDSFYYVDSNGLPDHETQVFNPNVATEQDHFFRFSKNPTFACSPSCLPGGTIGITKTGVALYNPLTNEGLNAVEGSNAERFDNCGGHADQMKVYHYHKSPTEGCGETYTGETDQFIGVALDGFPIYGPKVSDKAELLTSDDLDVCHGRMVDGQYRYHLTYDFPYIMGCYWGTQARENSKQASYACTDQGTDATEWGYLCSCMNWDPRQALTAVECPYLTEAEGGVYVTTAPPTTTTTTTTARPIPTTAAPTTRPIPTTRLPTTRPIPTTKAPFRKPFPGSNSRPGRPHFKRKNTLDTAERELLRRWLEKLLRREK